MFNSYFDLAYKQTPSTNLKAYGFNLLSKGSFRATHDMSGKKNMKIYSKKRLGSGSRGPLRKRGKAMPSPTNLAKHFDSLAKRTPNVVVHPVTKSGYQKRDINMFKRSIRGSSNQLGINRLWNNISPVLEYKNVGFYPGVVSSTTSVSDTTEASTGILQCTGQAQIFEQYGMLSIKDFLQYASHNCETGIGGNLLGGSNSIYTADSLGNFTKDSRQCMIQSYKQTFEFFNPTFSEVHIELIECRPRKFIYDGIYVGNVPNGSNCSVAGSSPIQCLERDLTDQSTNTSEAPFDSPSFHTRNVIGVSFDRTSKSFHRNYVVLSRKKVILSPGGTLSYDVVIPPFVRDSDFTRQSMRIDTGGSTPVISVVPDFATFTRFLCVRAYGAIEQLNNNLTLLQPNESNKAQHCGIKLNVLCHRIVETRPLPNMYKKRVVMTGYADNNKNDIGFNNLMTTANQPTLGSSLTGFSVVTDNFNVNNSG